MIARELPKGCCAVAAAYAVACFAKYFDARGIVVHTEHEHIALHAQKLMQRIGINGSVEIKQREGAALYEYAVKDEIEIAKFQNAFGHDGTQTQLHLVGQNFVCERCVTAFITAAFLMSGMVTNPEREYHLELTSSRHQMMKDVEALLVSRGFQPGYINRKGLNVLYFKASEQIEDLLTFMGASNAALEIMNQKVYRDFRNKANRITNCETANIEKTVAANYAALQAIDYLETHHALAALPLPLQQAAQLRKENPELGLKELAQKFEPPLSKSGLSHRLKKLEDVANTMKERKHHA